MAMASAMNGRSGGGGGIASLMKNPVFLMNMMTGTHTLTPHRQGDVMIMSCFGSFCCRAVWFGIKMQ